MIAKRILFLNISYTWLFYLLALMAAGVFAAGIYRHAAVWKRGLKNHAVLFSWSGLANIFWDALVTRRIWKDNPAGIMHTLILWGFLGLFAGTALSSLDHYVYSFLQGSIYLIYSLALEIAGLMLMAGLLWAFISRYVQKVKRLENRSGDLIVLGWLFIVAFSGFMLEGIRLAGQRVEWADWSFAGNWIAHFWQSPQAAMAIYPLFWWSHAILSLAVIAAIPFLKIFHMIAAPIYFYFKDQPVEVVKTENRDLDNELFSFQEILSFDACTRCGRCVEVCPSAGAGELFSPRDVIGHIRSGLLGRYGAIKYFPDVFKSGIQNPEQKDNFYNETIWHCTTCGACQNACPVYVDPPASIRKERCICLEDGSDVSSVLLQTLEKLDRYNNPWVNFRDKRKFWLDGAEAPVLSDDGGTNRLCYFVGCTTSMNNRAHELARSFARILKYAEIPFGVIGEEEPCCGDIARRLGEDGLFEEQIESCAETFEELKVRNIVTSSPHCFNTFVKESANYRTAEYAGNNQINFKHYSQVLNELIETGRIVFKKPLHYKVTYHDPCYLGRHNHIYDEPRNIISAIPGIELIEMDKNRENSFCCGGGGGRMWQPDMKAEIKISEIRIREAATTGAQILITACPLCLVMLDDASKTAGLEDSLRVMDLNELVLNALDTN